MSFDQELTITQFGQGVYSNEDMLSHFSQLAKDEKTHHLFDLFALVQQLNPSDSEVEQAIGDTLPDHSDSYLFVRSRSGKRTLGLSTGTEKIGSSYSLLLDLFKTVYQRHFTLKKGNSNKWRYQDLSNGETVQNILARHHELIEEVYNNAGFRGEFASLAKLWNARSVSMHSRDHESVLPEQTRFTFLNYDEVITESLKLNTDKYMHSIMALSNSLNKALSIRHGLDAREAPRLTQAVVERHLREAYGTGLA